MFNICRNHPLCFVKTWPGDGLGDFLSPVDLRSDMREFNTIPRFDSPYHSLQVQVVDVVGRGQDFQVLFKFYVAYRQKNYQVQDTAVAVKLKMLHYYQRILHKLVHRHLLQKNSVSIAICTDQCKAS